MNVWLSRSAHYRSAAQHSHDVVGSTSGVREFASLVPDRAVDGTRSSGLDARAVCRVLMSNWPRLGRRSTAAPAWPEMVMDSQALPNVDIDAVGPRQGERFPDVVLPNQYGEQVDLHAKRGGRPALVVFHRSAAW